MNRSTPGALLNDARLGGSAELGRLLESYRNYLHLLASTRIHGRLRIRESPSDIVQETFRQACESFHQFRGTDESEFLAWLRRVLATRLARAYERHLAAEKRDVRREISWQEIYVSLDKSAAPLERFIVAEQTSVGAGVDRREQAVVVADVLAELPADYREVLVLRHVEGLRFPIVAERMSRSHGAVRMLYARALDSLRSKLRDRGLL